MSNSKDYQILRPAEGITPGLAQKSRARRETFRGLAQIENSSSPRRNDLVPKLVLEYRAIDSLRCAPRRLRKKDAAQIARITDSIKQFGLCRPVLTTGTGEIIDGHAVIDSCRALDITEVSCIIVDHLDQGDIRRLRIALNRIAERGIWDFAEMQFEIAELAVVCGEDFNIPGIEPEEMDIFLLDDEALRVTILDASPLQPVRPVTRTGDIWKLGSHIVACGDARDQMLASTILQGRLAQLVLTDPPYNVPIAGHVTGGKHREFVMASGEMSQSEFSTFLMECLAVMKSALAEGGLALVFMDWRGINSLLNAGNAIGFILHNIIIWAKTNGGMGSLYRSQHELIPLFKKGAAPHINNIALGKSGRWRSNLWTYPGASSLGSDAREGLAVHPTVKPTSLLADAILDVTRRGDLVFDPFAGSGSTLIAAESTGRHCCGIELDPTYVDVILSRWSKLTGGTPYLATTGEPFSAVEARRVAGDGVAEKSINSMPLGDSATDELQDGDIRLEAKGSQVGVS